MKETFVEKQIEVYIYIHKCVLTIEITHSLTHEMDIRKHSLSHTILHTRPHTCSTSPSGPMDSLLLCHDRHHRVQDAGAQCRLSLEVRASQHVSLGLHASPV